MPPALNEVEKLAQLSRKVPPEPPAKEKHAVSHRSLRRRLAPQAVEELVARYTAGEETPALSREYGISGSGLGELLRTERVSLRGHAITSEDAARAVRLYGRGMTITQIVAQIGYSHGTIRTALLMRGVAIRLGGHGKQMVSGE